MFKFPKSILILAAALALHNANGAEVNVYAAASLTDVMKDIAANYEKQSGDKIVFNFAASSLLARQIAERAPADIFVSADEAKMDDLQKAGLIVAETRRDLDRDVRSLSRGENQRIVIARALLSGPQLLLLDEPLTALDAKLKQTILDQLRGLHSEFGIPMLYVTHDPAEAIEICEEVLMLESGRISARGNPRELLG